MDTVGIRELKAHLSRHLKRVRSGVRPAVTERGKTIASISPVESSRGVDWAHQLVAEGHAQWNGGKPPAGRASTEVDPEDSGIRRPGRSPMTLYLDTSSLVKLYVEEVGSNDVRNLVTRATVVATSIVAYPETRSALTLLLRSGDLTAANCLGGKARFRGAVARVPDSWSSPIR